jgi:hypothetical protein
MKVHLTCLSVPLLMDVLDSSVLFLRLSHYASQARVAWNSWAGAIVPSQPFACWDYRRHCYAWP